jgi:RNA polymerase sigma-70 factor (ECF subfamily)
MKEPFVELNDKGAKEAFARIVLKHQKAVFAVAYARVGRVHDAEDVMQEVFVEAWRNLNKLRSPESIPAWLYKATMYKCKDHFRRMSRREKREAIFAESALMSAANPSPTDSERQEAMLRAIALLPKNIRTVVMLKHFARLRYAEISKMT